ncbi:hypothetical protein ACJIZ3_013704 [Penstemon smallii]|uniref:Uncharacterized protein n=1 Tax=Penstemon smallii TaxID=265156 RepID=A0ABD3RKX3_9LAMI
MASLITHFTASLFLCPLGIRRLLCSVSLYLKNPSLYKSRIWYFSEPKWKNFDLYSLLIALPISSLSHLFIFLAFSDHPTFKFSFLQQSFVLFLFWVLLVLINFKESLDLYSVPENFIFIFAGITFLIEFYMSGRGIVGLGGGVYKILGGPSAFFAEFLLSSGLVLKGTWILQVGLSLYTDVFGLKGCAKITGVALDKGDVDVTCELEDDKWRGLALMNFMFIGHVIVVIIIGVVLFGLLHSNRNLRCGEGSGHLSCNNTR